jgi:transcriptional regulator with XRE-family HTH domain
MSKIRELRGLIYAQYDSEADMAKTLKWTRQRLSKITNGAKEPDVLELNEISAALDCPVDDVVQIFLRHKSPNGQQSGSARL